MAPLYTDEKESRKHAAILSIHRLSILAIDVSQQPDEMLTPRAWRQPKAKTGSDAPVIHCRTW